MSHHDAPNRRPTIAPNAARTTNEAAAAQARELIRRLTASTREGTSTWLGRVEEAVCAYEIDFRAFLNGQRHHPPFELGAVLDSAFRQVSSAPQRTPVSRFAAEALEARFRAAERLLTHRLERDDRRLHAPTARSA